MKRLPKVASEMALQVLAYNLTRVMKTPFGHWSSPGSKCRTHSPFRNASLGNTMLSKHG